MGTGFAQRSPFGRFSEPLPDRRSRIPRAVANRILRDCRGAALGIGLSQMVSHALTAFCDSGPDRIALGLRADMRLVTFIALAALVSVVVAELLPAVHVVSSGSEHRVRSSIDRLAEGRSCFGAVLLSAQVAFSLCSLSAAMLLGPTLSDLRDQPQDFARDGVAESSRALVTDSHNDRDLAWYYQRVPPGIEAVPAIEAAARAD